MSISKETEEVISELSSYTPKTPLGEKLIELRKKIITSGENLLEWEEIEKEISERRGGYENQAQ